MDTYRYRYILIIISSCCLFLCFGLKSADLLTQLLPFFLLFVFMLSYYFGIEYQEAFFNYRTYIPKLYDMMMIRDDDNNEHQFKTKEIESTRGGVILFE